MRLRLPNGASTTSNMTSTRSTMAQFEEPINASLRHWLTELCSCGVPEFYDDTCYSCNADPTFATNLVNGTCTNDTEQHGAATMMPICDSAWPTDGRNYSQSYTALRYRVMGNALLSQNRSILFSLCDWGTDEPWTWANETGNSWRMSNDIERMRLFISNCSHIAKCQQQPGEMLLASST